jgi:AcrR family transcriptional regulator
MDNRAYHHGDLERALIATGLQLMQETGDWAFSLRELARRAGVSHNAPYKHFADKQALLQAMAAEGFVALRQETEVVASAESPADALVAIGVAYVRFGRRRPALYRLMFNAMCPVAGAPQAGVALEAQGVLRGVLRRWDWGEGEAGAQALDLAVLAAWSLVHGVTQLFLDGYIGRPAEDDVDRLVTALLRLQMRGLHNVCAPAAPASCCG